MPYRYFSRLQYSRMAASVTAPAPKNAGAAPKTAGPAPKTASAATASAPKTAGPATASAPKTAGPATASAPKTAGPATASAPKTAGPAEGEGTGRAGAPGSGSPTAQTQRRVVDTPAEGKCGGEVTAAPESRMSSPSVPVAIAPLMSNGKRMPIFKSTEGSSAMHEFVYDDKLCEVPSVDLSVDHFSLTNNVDDHVASEGDNNDNDDDDILLEEEQKRQKLEKVSSSPQPAHVLNSNVPCAVSASCDTPSRLATAESTNSLASMPSLEENNKSFDETMRPFARKDVRLPEGYNLEGQPVPSRFSRSPSNDADSEDPVRQPPQRVTDASSSPLQQGLYTPFSVSSEEQRKNPSSLRSFSKDCQPERFQTSLQQRNQRNAWAGISVEEEGVNDGIESDDEDLEITGGTLDEPMTPHSFSSIRNLSQTKRRAVSGSLPIVALRAPCSKGAGSSASFYSLPRNLSLNTSSTLFPQPSSECATSSQIADSGRIPRQEDASVELTPLSRPGLCPPPNLPPEPISLENLNVGEIRLQSFKDNVVECNRAEKRVISNNQILLNDKYVIYRKWNLGAGSLSKVLLCYELQNKAYYAMKILDRGRLQRQGIGVGCAVHQIKREIAILKKLRHPSIVALVEVIDDPQSRKIYLVLELAERGEIMSMNNDGTVIPMRGKSTFSEREVARVMRSVLNALCFVHHLGIVHRDIKPPNIVLTSQGDAKLLDFGASIVVDECTERVRREGSVAFLPPEMLISPEVSITPRSRVSSRGPSRSVPPVCAAAASGNNATHAVRTEGVSMPSASGALAEASETTQTHSCESVGMADSSTVPISTPSISLTTLPCSRQLSNNTAELYNTSFNTLKCGLTPPPISNSLNSGTTAAPVDLFRADVFSVGVTAFVLLMGRLPWRAKGALSQFRAIVSNPDPFSAELSRSDAQQSQLPPRHRALSCPVSDMTSRAMQSYLSSSTNGNGSARPLHYSSSSHRRDNYACAASSLLRDNFGDSSHSAETPPDNVPSSLAVDFIKRCICIEPSKRATVAELLEHAWIRQADSSDDKAKEKAAESSPHESRAQSTNTVAPDAAPRASECARDVFCALRRSVETAADSASEEGHLRPPSSLFTSTDLSNETEERKATALFLSRAVSLGDIHVSAASSLSPYRLNSLDPLVETDLSSTKIA